MKALYAGLVTQVDRWVGRILETFERLQLDKNTLVLQLTDHGHLFGEHDLEGKPGGQLGNLYETTTRVPMMMRHPDGLGAGKRIQGLAQPVDAPGHLVPEHARGGMEALHVVAQAEHPASAVRLRVTAQALEDPGAVVQRVAQGGDTDLLDGDELPVEPGGGLDLRHAHSVSRPFGPCSTA